MGVNMIRLFLKTIMISLISCTLMVGDMVAYADSQTHATKNTDGSYQRTKTVDLADVSNGDTAMNFITMLAIGVIGMKLLTYKKWTTDMTVAAAAGAAYIIGEVMNMFQTKKDMEATSASVTLRSDGKVDSTQVEYIKKLKESYEEIIKSLKTKKTLQTAAFAGFLAAAGIAAWQMFSEEGKYASCEAAILQSTATLKSCVAAGSTGVGATEAFGCASCLTDVGLLSKSIKLMKAEEVAFEPSMMKNMKMEPKEIEANVTCTKPCAGATATAAKSSVMGACNAYLVEKKLNKAYGVLDFTTAGNYNLLLNNILFPPQLISNFSFENKLNKDEGKVRTFLKNAIETVFPSAKAGMMSMLGLAGGAAAIFFGVEKALGFYLDEYIFTPKYRAMLWGAFALMTKMAMSATDEKIAEAEKNIEKLDKILNETSKLNQGVKGSNPTITSPQIFTGSVATQDQSFSDGQKTGCIAGSTSSGCKSLTTAASTSTGFSSLPAGLQDVASQVTGLGDSLSGKSSLSAAGLNSAASIGSKAAALAKNLKKQQIAINDLLKKKGKEPIKFDGEMQKARAGMLSAVKNSLNKKGTTAGGFLNSIGMSVPSNSEVKPETGLDGLAIPKENVAGGAGVMPENKETMNFGFDEAPGAGDAGGATAKNDEFGGAAYDIKGNDIHDDGASIFEIISTRYLKSGYPKLLEEVK